jgi:hypothetical protein
MNLIITKRSCEKIILSLIASLIYSNLQCYEYVCMVKLRLLLIFIYLTLILI